MSELTHLRVVLGVVLGLALLAVLRLVLGLALLLIGGVVLGLVDGLALLVVGGVVHRLALLLVHRVALEEEGGKGTSLY